MASEANYEVTEDTNGSVRRKYNTLIARDDCVFTFLDDTFVYPDDERDFHGATGTRMVPVTEEEMQRRREQMRDPEWSGLHHIYVEQVEDGLDKSWTQWIDEQLRIEGDRLLYDPSYEHKYGEIVREKVSRELGMENIVAVECIGGGRMFSGGENENEWGVVYDQEAVAVAFDAEEGQFPDDGY
ncbi:hypothetical protein [Natrinema sp. DC36]|uniref:hypothetical protein n=1 Tax=Natrinema sp. DC36 TaxID=2878680 RepID=UPI001CF0D003|nr:hypothetical protein [Natrinema sp. DC36]